VGPAPADNEDMKLLVLCTNRVFRKLLEESLPQYELDFISEASKLKDLDYMNCVFQHDSYDVLVLTNMGLSMSLAMHHVCLLPEVRTYGVLLISGLLSESDKRTCAQYQVETMEAPMALHELCEAIDRLGRPAHRTEPGPVKPRRTRNTARSAKSGKRA